MIVSIGEYCHLHCLEHDVEAKNLPEDPYTLEQLKEPPMNESIVRPLVGRLYDPDDVSIGKTAHFTRYEDLEHTTSRQVSP